MPSVLSGCWLSNGFCSRYSVSLSCWVMSHGVQQQAHRQLVQPLPLRWYLACISPRLIIGKMKEIPRQARPQKAAH